jgi:hypothetical protein
VVSIPTSYAASPIAPASRQLVQLLRKDNNVSNAETQSQGTTSARTSLLYVSFWKEKKQIFTGNGPADTRQPKSSKAQV